MIAKVIVCPQCGKDDMIQKVSAVYDGGVSTTQYDMPVAIQSQGKTYYGVQQRTATTLTPVAQKLAPPSKPVYMGIFASSEKEGCGDILSGGISFLLSQVWWIVVAAIAGVIVGSLIPTTTEWGTKELNAGVAWVVGIIVFGVLFVRRIIGDNRKAQAARRAVPRWEKAIRKWSELYYCARNDCVFDPATGVSVPSDRMSELLYP